MADHISLEVLQQRLHETLEEVAHDAVSITVTKDGTPIAAIVPYKALQLLEDYEDKFDLLQALLAKQEHDESGEPTTSLQDVARELGIV